MRIRATRETRPASARRDSRRGEPGVSPNPCGNRLGPHRRRDPSPIRWHGYDAGPQLHLACRRSDLLYGAPGVRCPSGRFARIARRFAKRVPMARRLCDRNGKSFRASPGCQTVAAYRQRNAGSRTHEPIAATAAGIKRRFFTSMDSTHRRATGLEEPKSPNWTALLLHVRATVVRPGRGSLRFRSVLSRARNNRPLSGNSRQ